MIFKLLVVTVTALTAVLAAAAIGPMQGLPETAVRYGITEPARPMSISTEYYCVASMTIQELSRHLSAGR